MTGVSGRAYTLRTQISRHGASDGERVRVPIRVDDGGARERLDPLAEELVIATPDGEFLRAYTLANASEERRRYVGIAPWMIAVVIVAGAALVALWLALT